MNCDLSIIQEWLGELHKLYEDPKAPNRVKIFETSYIGIKADGSVTPKMTSCWNFRNSDCKYGIVIAKYSYLVLTRDDISFFTLFLSDDQQGEYLEKNDWRIYFDIPIMTLSRTYYRTCYIENFNKHQKISLSISVEVRSDEIERCFKIFELAQQCSTQKELNILNTLYSEQCKAEDIKTLFEKRKNIKDLQ